MGRAWGSERGRGRERQRSRGGEGGGKALGSLFKLCLPFHTSRHGFPELTNGGRAAAAEFGGELRAAQTVAIYSIDWSRLRPAAPTCAGRAGNRVSSGGPPHITQAHKHAHARTRGSSFPPPDAGSAAIATYPRRWLHDAITRRLTVLIVIAWHSVVRRRAEHTSGTPPAACRSSCPANRRFRCRRRHFAHRTLTVNMHATFDENPAHSSYPSVVFRTKTPFPLNK